MKTSSTVQPHNPWLTHSVRIDHVTPETPGVATYDLVFDDQSVGDGFAFRPGQFNMLYLPGLGEIAISISGDPSQSNPVPHTIREAGNVTRALALMAPGSSIGLRGPFGSNWPITECMSRNVVLVAGGIGLAPLRPVIYELLANRSNYGQLTLVIGAREPAGLLYPSEYGSWRDRGMDVRVTVDRASESWHGHIGMVTSVLDRIPLPDPKNTLLMACGPEVMMWYTIQTALTRGITPDSAYVSLERNMNCAIGLCGHCQFGPQFICKDGPVFRYDRVCSILKVDDL